LLAAAGEDRVLRLWQSHGSEVIFSSFSDGQRVAFSPERRRIGPVIRGDEIGWLELARSAELVDEAIGTAPMTSAQFTPDGRVLGFAWRSTVGFVDPAGARVLGSSRPGQRVAAFRFDPRGDALIEADQTGIVRRPMRWTDLAVLECSAREDVIVGAGWNALAFSARGDWLAAANSRSNAAYLFDRTLTNRPAILGPHPGANAVAVSPDGRWLATGSSADRRVNVWDTGSGAKVLDLAAGTMPRAAFSADGKWLATFGDIFELRETGSWRPATALPFPEGRPLLGAAAFSPDARLLAIVRDLHSVQLFDVTTFQSLGTLTPPNERGIQTLEFSPDCGRLAAGCLTGRVQIWDLRRIRERLAGFGLDWELPRLEPGATNAPAWRVSVAR
jgi:WD40 repeat protein